MPAMLDDPTARPNRRWPPASAPPRCPGIRPQRVTLGDGTTRATILPFTSRRQVPAGLVGFLCRQLNDEIAGGDTYPMVEPMAPDAFAAYWFQEFAAVMLLGDDWAVDADGCLQPFSPPPPSPGAAASPGPDDADRWAAACLGSYYVKPNYPGRSSHVCNAGFLVAAGARGRRVGRLLGESYVAWAARLGYAYSVFNLVYETNEASCRIWDALGFCRIGRVPRCGRLRSFPGREVDAIVYGRALAVEEGDTRLE